MKTEDLLDVVWTLEDGQEMLDGIYVLGYWRGDVEPRPGIPAWAWSIRNQFSESRFFGPGWRATEWQIRIREWPAPQDWEKTLRATLQAFLDAGARVAWAGLEGGFADPPSLFVRPSMHSSGVWAALSPRLGFICPAQLGRPFQTITDAQFDALHEEL